MCVCVPCLIEVRWLPMMSAALSASYMPSLMMHIRKQPAPLMFVAWRVSEPFLALVMCPWCPA